MEQKQAKHLVFRKVPEEEEIQPERDRLIREGPNNEVEDMAAIEALCAEYERRFAEEQFAEGGAGCDYPEGPLSASGCFW